jgi:hypothetical protein
LVQSALDHGAVDDQTHGLLIRSAAGATRASRSTFTLRHARLTSRFGNQRSEVNILVSKQKHWLDFYRDMLGQARNHRRGSPSRRPALVRAVPRIHFPGRFAGIMLPSVVGVAPPISCPASGISRADL